MNVNNIAAIKTAKKRQLAMGQRPLSVGITGLDPHVPECADAAHPKWR